MRKLFVITFALFALIGWAVQSNAAQTANVCPQFIADAIETVGNNCTGLGRNNACYGYDRVLATFEQLPSPEYFTQPRDIADLFQLRSVETSPLRTTLNEWGISLLSVQANLPDALPGQNVIFMLAGDAQAENGVDPDADTGETPMQSFYFRTGIGQTDCLNAPDTLIVQGPRGVSVDFTANGAEIRIGSTVALRTYPLDSGLESQVRSQYGLNDVSQLMELVVLDGEAILNPGTPQEQHVTPGQHALRCLGEAQNLGIDGDEDDTPVFEGCPWLDIRLLFDDELGRFSGYEGMVLNYAITIPDGANRPVVANVPTNAPIPPTATSAATSVPPVVPPATSMPTIVPTVYNAPASLTLEVPSFSMERNAFYLTGVYSDPDDDDLLLRVDWGDGTAPSVYTLEGGSGEFGGGEGGIAPLVAGSAQVYHTFAQNGTYSIMAEIRDSVGNSTTEYIEASVEPIRPLSITKISGDGQVAELNQDFEELLVAKVTDAGGAPVQDFSVSVSPEGDVTVGCVGEFDCTVTGIDGTISVRATAGSETGSVEVHMGVYEDDETTFNLEVAPGDTVPTVDILYDGLNWQNGDVFSFSYNIDDPDGDLMEVKIFWGDSDTPEVFSDMPSGTYNADHEFTAAGLLLMRVEAFDGTYTAAEDYFLDVIPLYPLHVTNTPQTSWSGNVEGGEVYPGVLRVTVRDSDSDPVYNIELVPLESVSLERVGAPGVPAVTLSGPGGGYADVIVTSDCPSRSSIKIGAPDPTGSPYPGFPFTYQTTAVSVNQVVAYMVIPHDGDNQTVFVGQDFPEVLRALLLNSAGNGVDGEQITFTLNSSGGATFKSSGGTIYTVTTSSDGFADSDIITAGGPETVTVDAQYAQGFCSYAASFTLHVENFPRPVGPTPGGETAEATEVPVAEVTPEVTDEVMTPEITPEATDELVTPDVTPEVTDEPVAPEVTPDVTDEAVSPEVTDEPVAPEVTDEAVSPEVTEEATALAPTPTATPPVRKR